MLAAGRNALMGVGWGVMVDLSSDSRAVMHTDSSKYLTCQSDVDSHFDLVKDKECSDFGCCQNVLKEGNHAVFGVHFSFDQVSSCSDCPCSYGMLVESSWYTFSKEDIFGYNVLPQKHPRGVPFVIDFAIRNGSCPVAGGPPPPPDYACRSSNHVCANATSGGYLCKCSENYQGNPYIPNGCKGTYVRCCFCCCEQQKTLESYICLHMNM